MDKKISNFEQTAYVRRYVLTEGKAAGLKVTEVYNGNLRFMLNESKALDIMQLWYKGENVSFLSKNGFSTKNEGFSERFEGGMIYTCGLDSIGAREGFAVHGSIHNTPAKVVAIFSDEKEIKVVAEIENTELFGKDLMLKREIATEIGSDKLCLKDMLINKGTKTEKYCLLYHCNLGYPMLDESVTIDYDGRTIVPRTKYSETRLSECKRFSAPVDNEEERCFFIENDCPTVTVKNNNSGRVFTLSYSVSTLPKMILWQSGASHDYALGIEPATSFLDDKFKYNEIKPDEKIEFKVQLSLK